MQNNSFVDVAENTEVPFYTEKKGGGVSRSKNDEHKFNEARPAYVHFSNTKRYDPKPTVENLEALLEFLGVAVEYNVISKRIRIKPSSPDVKQWTFQGAISDSSALSYIVSKAEEYDLKTRHIDRFLDFVGAKRPVNPAKEWIESAPWDGVSRQQAIFDSVIATQDNAYKEAMIRTWMAQAIAVLYSDEPISARGVLVFQGRQNRGKTLWFKSLFPAGEDSFAKEGMSVDPNNRDSVMSCLRYWAVELGELDGIFKKSDMESLKRFIGATTDVWRLPYERCDRELKRTTVFYASVNGNLFLRDSENTRFWTIPIESCNEKHGVNVQQLWAEMLYLYKRGDINYRLTSTMLDTLSEKNRDFTVVSPVEEKFLSSYDWTKKEFTRYLSATQICEEIGIKVPTHADLITIGRLAGDLGCRSRRVAGYKQLSMPDLKSNDKKVMDEAYYKSDEIEF